MVMPNGSDHPLSDRLADLARLATAPPAQLTVAQVVGACAIVRDALDAEDAYIVRAGDPHFVRLGCDADPTTYEIKQKGYYLIRRELAARPDLTVGGAVVADRLVQRAVAAEPGARPTHLAAILPGYENRSDLLIVRGPWPAGLTRAHLAAMEVARPLLAFLLANLLDAERQARQRHQLSMLAEVAAAFTEARQMDRVLTTIATAVAKASGFDWVTIVLFDPALERIVDRAQNVTRFSDTQTAAALWTLDHADAVWLADARRMTRTGRPILIRDVFAILPGPRDERLRRFDETLRRHYERAHILSTAVFPIRFQDQTLGSMFFSATTRHEFEADEVEFLTTLVAQAAAGIAGLRLHEELRRANASLAHLAIHDPLTGLPNRALFHDRLSRALTPRHAEHGDTAVALLFIDLDNFKAVNDTLGHPAGDALLVAAAGRLAAAVRPSDLVARFGGDEFVVLVDSAVTPAAAQHVAARLLESLRAPFAIADREVTIDASVGIALGVPGATTADDLLREADIALYQAKDAGKGRGVLFDAGSVRAPAPPSWVPCRLAG
jgi:diguanylate cyclase (GGDEF)-like protein